MKILSSKIARDCGKTGFTMKWAYPGGGRRAPLVYATTREEVESLDLSRFLATFGVYQKPSLLRHFRARIFHTIDGYDRVDAPLFEIPDVRSFYAYLSAKWPSWVFTSSLLGPNLWTLALCVTPNLSVQGTSNQCCIRVPASAVSSLLLAAQPACTLLGLRAGLSSGDRTRRMEKLARYFKL